MAVIKADNLAVQAQAGAFSMADIEHRARAILAAANQRAHRLLVEAQEEAENLKRQAHAQALVDGKKEGLAKGLEEGRKLGKEQALTEHRQEFAQAVASLAEAAGQVEQSRTLLEVDGRQAVVGLAIAIADKVTKRLGALDPEVLLANVDAALRLVVGTTDLRIAVHPAQHATLADALPRIALAWPQFKHVDLIADGTLTPGGCRIFTAGGQIDADLQLQLDRLANELVPEPAAEPVT